MSKQQKKSEGITLVLSLVLGLFGIFGVGYFYTKRVKKGIMFLSISVLLAMSVLFLFVQIDAIFSFDDPNDELRDHIWSTIALFILLLMSYFGIWIYQIIDSLRSCRYYNENIETV